jgi:hypothetical protein
MWSMGVKTVVVVFTFKCSNFKIARFSPENILRAKQQNQPGPEVAEKLIHKVATFCDLIMMVEFILF